MEVYQIGAVGSRLARAPASRPCDPLAQLLVGDPGDQRCRLAAASGDGVGGLPSSSGRLSGVGARVGGPGAKRSAAAHGSPRLGGEPLEDRSARAGRARTPTPTSVVCTCSVPSRAMRAGHALRATSSPTTRRPGADDPAASLRSRRSAPSSPLDNRADPLHQAATAFPGVTSSTCAGSAGSACRDVAVIDGLAAPGDPLGEDLAARRGSSSESTSSSRRSGGDARCSREQRRPRRAAAREPRAAARPAIRSSAGRGRRRRRRSRRGAGRGRSILARHRGRAGPRALRASAARRVLEPGAGETELSRALARSRGASSVEDAMPDGDELGPELGHPLRPGRERFLRRQAQRHAAQRGVPLSERLAVSPRRAPPGPAAVARARGRSRHGATAGPPLTTAEPVRREHERRQLVRSRSVRSSRAPFSRASLPPPRLSTTSVSTGTSPRLPRATTRAASAPKRTSWASARVRGEKPCVPTWSDSSRLVLPAPFGPTTSTMPGSSVEIERRVRAEVAERDRRRDQAQPASRIGMIRYQKSSSPAASAITAGAERVDQLQRQLVARPPTRCRRGGSRR